MSPLSFTPIKHPGPESDAVALRVELPGRSTVRCRRGTTVLTGTMRVNAHHSFFMLFDASQDVEVTGVVTEFQFIAPHAYILVDVTDETGAVTSWELETTSPGQLAVVA